jgi:hypothetical protein
LKEGYAEENAKMRVLEDKVPRLEDETKEFALISEKLKKLPSKKVLSELESKKEELEKVQAKIQVALSRIPELRRASLSWRQPAAHVRVQQQAHRCQEVFAAFNKQEVARRAKEDCGHVSEIMLFSESRDIQARRVSQGFT